MIRHLSCITTAALLFAFAATCTRAAPPAPAPGSDGFVSLFNGKDLTGWEQKGGKAKYTVQTDESGTPMIVGTTVPNTPNSFLCTTKRYGDFVLEYEFKCDNGLNSGVQVRSNAYDEQTTVDAGPRTIRIGAGRVHGYQVEIDADKPDRRWTGGIYDEARRGWLYPLSGKPEAQAAFKRGQWNKVRVEAVGDRIRTFVNGVPCADLVDSLTLEGFVGLQVHGVGNRTEPMQVRWRNLRIKDMGRHVWKPLFDGKSLAGWEPTVENTWRVEDGVIIGSCPASENRHSILISEKPYDDFTVRVSYKALKGNSGLYFRVEKVPGAVAVHGFQAEIDQGTEAGGLYETGGRAWVVQPKRAETEKRYDYEDWNTMTVHAHGKRIVVHLNGHKSAELTNDPGRTEGYLGMQLHGGQEMDVRFRSVEMLVKQ